MVQEKTRLLQTIEKGKVFPVFEYLIRRDHFLKSIIINGTENRKKER